MTLQLLRRTARHVTMRLVGSYPTFSPLPRFPSFIMELEEDGLIEVRVIDEERYLPTSQLAELERYTHLYYDLSINIAGIDAIHHMLERIELLQQEVRSLRNELEFYR
jgi:chaperone modulatory protein CbpM